MLVFFSFSKIFHPVCRLPLPLLPPPTLTASAAVAGTRFRIRDLDRARPVQRVRRARQPGRAGAPRGGAKDDARGVRGGGAKRRPGDAPRMSRVYMRNTPCMTRAYVSDAPRMCRAYVSDAPRMSSAFVSDTPRMCRAYVSDAPRMSRASCIPHTPAPPRDIQRASAHAHLRALHERPHPRACAQTRARARPHPPTCRVPPRVCVCVCVCVCV